MKRHLPEVHAYADDNQLYISFKPGSSASELEAVTALQDCILHIKTWMTADKLNGDKTVRIHVLSTLCDVISFNGQGQLCPLTCAE